MTLMTLPPRLMAELLGSIDVDSADHIQVLGDGAKIANLGLSEDETLVVQLPGTSHISTIVGCILMQVIAEDSPVDSWKPHHETCGPRI
jgi:hypothetical protein